MFLLQSPSKPVILWQNIAATSLTVKKATVCWIRRLFIIFNSNQINTGLFELTEFLFHWAGRDDRPSPRGDLSLSGAYILATTPGQ